MISFKSGLIDDSRTLPPRTQDNDCACLWHFESVGVSDYTGFVVVFGNFSIFFGNHLRVTNFVKVGGRWLGVVATTYMVLFDQIFLFKIIPSIKNLSDVDLGLKLGGWRLWIGLGGFVLEGVAELGGLGLELGDWGSLLQFDHTGVNSIKPCD